jgi:hypothetical protein
MGCGSSNQVSTLDPLLPEADTSCSATPSASDPIADGAWGNTSGKYFCAALSHHKAVCSTEAHLLKTRLEQRLLARIFLDSDDLVNAGVHALTDAHHHVVSRRSCRRLGMRLMEHVRESDVMIVLKTAAMFQRPWVLLELITAIDSGVPMIAVSIAGQDFEAAACASLLTNIDTTLEAANPGATEVLWTNGVDLLDVAYKLSSVIPKIPTLHFDPADVNASRAQVSAIINAMTEAAPIELGMMGQAKWMAKRAIDSGGGVGGDSDRAVADEPASASDSRLVGLVQVLSARNLRNADSDVETVIEQIKLGLHVDR